MLPNNVIDAVVEGNLGGETVKMEIDVTATAHLMSVLTDLYSDRIMAFIREYATNAHDSHIEAGVTRPIEITLPNRMSNYYHIRDFGIGLDVDDIRNIYSKYGSSTKRASNDFNGMLGLGCKSAMTYAAQFSIVSVKDGMKYNVAVSRGADGVGEMQVIDTTPTTETNGVEIIIPVKSSDLWAVAEKVNQFFQWWPEGTVLVNGKQPRRFVGREVAKNLYMVDGLENDLIVMGNVPYLIPFEGGIYAGNQDRYGYNRKNFSVVYFAEMGEVTFAPNRESLTTTKNTKTAVEKAKKLFVDNLRTSIQKEFDALDTFIAALKHKRELDYRYKDLDLGEFTYKGHKIPTAGFEAPNKTMPKKDYKGNVVLDSAGKPKMEKVYDPFIWYDANGGSPESSRNQLDLETIERYNGSLVFVLNGPKSLTTHQKMKIRRAYDADVFNNVYVFITSEATKPGGVWTDGIEIVDWSLIRDFKIAGSGTSDSTKHTVYDAAGGVSERAIPDAEKVVYVSPTHFKEDSYYGPKVGVYRKYFNDAGYSFVLLAANRHAKFKREHPNALTIHEAVKHIISEYEKTLTESDKALLAIDSEDVTRLKHLRGVDIADPTVVDFRKKVGNGDARAKVVQRRSHHENMVRGLSGVRLTEIETVNVFENYPLIRLLSSYEIQGNTKHVADYIKAVMDSKKGN